MSLARNTNLQAILGTLGLHILLFFLCYLSIIKRPLPLEVEDLKAGKGGIVVNYGLDEKGSGDDINNAEALVGKEQKVEESTNMTTKNAVQETESPPNIVTQDVDKTAPSVPKSTISATVKPAPAKIIREEALFKVVKKEQTVGNSKGDGTDKLFKGNQGSKDGDPLASNYGAGGSGTGDIKLDLQNRKFVVLPKIQDDGQSSGRIVIDIKVDKSGMVVYARAGARGSTISDTQLWKKCENAVLGARVNASDVAPEAQLGKVVFHFTVR